MLFKKKEPKPKKVKKQKAPKPPKVKFPRKRISVLEIVSLISIFAILGAVGYLVYKNHFKKQIPETDKEIVNQLNASVSKHSSKSKQYLLKDIIGNIEDDGIIFDRLTLADTNTDLIYDSNKNLFGIYEKGKGVTYPVDIERKEANVDPTLWKFIKKKPSDYTLTFSYYLLDDISGVVSTTGGLDVGTNDDITIISYSNVGSTKRNVVIRTNSYETELMVSETIGDTINHYGNLGKLTVKRLHTDSYHEYGDCKYAYVPDGRVVAESGGNIDVALVTSTVAFLQENGSGTIKNAYASTYRVRNSSTQKDDKYGKKKELEFDENVLDNEEKAKTAGEMAQNAAIIEERIQRGLEKNPNAIGYAKEGSTITVFDTFQQGVDYFAGKTGTINVTNGGVLNETLIIKDSNITIIGNKNSVPTIEGNIEISHTSGNHEVVFENIKFVNKDSEKDHIVDRSNKENEEKLNSLKFYNCEFAYDGKESEKATICLEASSLGSVSTELNVNYCSFNYKQFSQSGITTRGICDSRESINRGESIFSEKKHIISNNTFKCSSESINSAIVTNCASIANNTFESYNSPLMLIPTISFETDFQFDVSVTGNTFKKSNYLFSLMDVDSIYESEDFKFTFDNSNSYSNVNHIAYFDVATANRFVEAKASEWQGKSWNGVSDKSFGVTLDNITLNLEGTPTFGTLTLENGERIKTYTECSSDSERHGYTLKDDLDNKYYLYTKFNEEVNVFLKEDTNEAYVSLLGSGDVESLSVKETPANIDWLDEDIFNDEETYKELKYLDPTGEEKVGALYKLDEVFTTLNGNTYVNSELVQNEKFLRVNHLPEPTPDEPEEPETPEEPELSSLPKVFDELEESETPEDPETPDTPETPEEPEEVVVKKGLEVYISDIGERTKLVLTNDENPFVSEIDAPTQLVVSVPNDAKLVLSGRYDVELQGTVENLVLRDRLNVKFATGSSVSKLCEISGENAENLKLENNGAIEKLVVNSKANITNNSLIRNLVTGEVGGKHIEETLQETSGAFIYNKGNILNFVTYAKTEVLNNINGYIDNLIVTFVEGYRDLCVGSYITNNGTICTGEGNIYLYTECKLFNYGVIGLEGRSTVGGLIVIGDHGESDSHDGVVINNVTGIIWAGKNEEDEILVTRTFIIYGVTEGKGEIHPEVSITSDGVIAGTSTDEEKVLIVELDISPSVVLEIKI